MCKVISLPVIGQGLNEALAKAIDSLAHGQGVLCCQGLVSLAYHDEVGVVVEEYFCDYESAVARAATLGLGRVWHIKPAYLPPYARA